MAGGALNIFMGNATGQASLTRTVIGGFVLILILSLLDLFGGPLSTLAGALAMLAAVFVILTDYVPILQKLGGVVGGGQKAPATGKIGGAGAQAGYPTNQH